MVILNRKLIELGWSHSSVSADVCPWASPSFLQGSVISSMKWGVWDEQVLGPFQFRRPLLCLQTLPSHLCSVECSSDVSGSEKPELSWRIYRNQENESTKVKNSSCWLNRLNGLFTKPFPFCFWVPIYQQIISGFPGWEVWPFERVLARINYVGLAGALPSQFPTFTLFLHLLAGCRGPSGGPHRPSG